MTDDIFFLKTAPETTTGSLLPPYQSTNVDDDLLTSDIEQADIEPAVPRLNGTSSISEYFSSGKKNAMQIIFHTLLTLFNFIVGNFSPIPSSSQNDFTINSYHVHIETIRPLTQVC